MLEQLTMSFREFCESWVETCLSLEREQPDKYTRARMRGIAFKELFRELLSSFELEGYKILEKKKIIGIDHKFNFLFAKVSASDVGDIEPSDVLAVLEAKSHGFFGYAPIHEMKSVFEAVKRSNPQTKLFYVTFRETGTHDDKFKEIFANRSQNYYRLSDSGDGMQIPPKRYFPGEWDRLLKDLNSIVTDNYK